MEFAPEHHWKFSSICPKHPQDPRYQFVPLFATALDKAMRRLCPRSVVTLWQYVLFVGIVAET